MIRSTFIAGFPGETEEEFEHLLQFMREARIDRAGCFAYSPVEGAAANDIPGMLPQEVREERRARFMAVAEEVSAAKLRERIGATMQVLVDSAPALGRKGGVGRSYADAPEIDGTVQLLPPEKLSKQLKVGEFTRARIVGTQGHDLVGGSDLNGVTESRQEPAHAGFHKQQSRQSRLYDLLVPRKGLEPPRCYSLVPETSASTNSATWAFQERKGFYIKNIGHISTGLAR